MTTTKKFPHELERLRTELANAECAYLETNGWLSNTSDFWIKIIGEHTMIVDRTVAVAIQESIDIQEK